MIVDPKLVVPGVFRRHLSHYLPKAYVEHLSDANPKPGFNDFSSEEISQAIAN